MANLQLGNTLVIANPASHSGKGAVAAERVSRFLASYQTITSSFDVCLTSAPGHAVSLASGAGGADTVIALGGDGVIHEVVNGLMEIAQDRRPALGIIPMGSGNDYARTLGITHNHPETALAELLAGHISALDLGLVESDANERAYFAETLSFGMDAAIALDTTRRRAGGTRQEGEALFATSAIRIVSEGARGVTAEVAFDDCQEARRLQSFMFAVQIGPTYGGGFRICPDASPVDGKLSVCFNVRQARVPRLLVLLGLARFGLHARSRMLELRECGSLAVRFPEGGPPCQVDGEALSGSRFHVCCVPRALNVIVPQHWSWGSS